MQGPLGAPVHPLTMIPSCGNQNQSCHINSKFYHNYRCKIVPLVDQNFPFRFRYMLYKYNGLFLTNFMSNNYVCLPNIENFGLSSPGSLIFLFQKTSLTICCSLWTSCGSFGTLFDSGCFKRILSVAAKCKAEILSKMKRVMKCVWGGGRGNIAYLLRDPAAPGLIPSVP